MGDGLLHVTEPRPDLGVPLLAERGDRPCLVRWSRAMGLPDGWPDFEGLALRFAAETAGGGDLLLASTGTCKVARHVLLLRGAGRHGVLSSLIPVASQAGPLLFRATPVDDADPPQRYRISVAVGLSDWDDVAVLDAAWGPDQPIRFDPVTRPLAGIRQYAGVTALREPAYALARKAASAKT